MPKSYSNLDPEEALEMVRKYFATTKLTPQKALRQRKIKKRKEQYEKKESC